MVLGRTPTVLQMMSPSPAETAMVAIRRPFLALLLSVASPATVFSPVESYYDGVEGLEKPLTAGVRNIFPYTAARLLGSGGGRSYASGLLSAMQYVAAMAAVANSAYLTYQLCMWTVCSFSPMTVFLPAL